MSLRPRNNLAIALRAGGFLQDMHHKATDEEHVQALEKMIREMVKYAGEHGLSWAVAAAINVPDDHPIKAFIEGREAIEPGNEESGDIEDVCKVCATCGRLGNHDCI